MWGREARPCWVSLHPQHLGGLSVAVGPLRLGKTKLTETVLAASQPLLTELQILPNSLVIGVHLGDEGPILHLAPDGADGGHEDLLLMVEVGVGGEFVGRHGITSCMEVGLDCPRTPTVEGS